MTDIPDAKDLSIPSSVDGGECVPIETLEELVEEMEKYGNPDVDKFSARLQSVIDEHSSEEVRDE